MIRGLLGKKLGMTQIFDKEGSVIPVTVIEVGPCTVLGFINFPLKVQLGYDPIKETKVNKPQLGFFKKIGISPMRIIREIPSSDNKDYQIGQEIKADFFTPGDYIDIQGTSIGKGFQGGMKRWHWQGGPAGHGSMHHRRVGSIGASATPSRTIKGMNMPGRMGGKTITVQGLRVMDVDMENNIILVSGAVPGSSNGDLTIFRSRKKTFRSLDEVKASVVHKVNPMKQSKAKAGVKKKKGKKK